MKKGFAVLWVCFCLPLFAGATTLRLDFAGRDDMNAQKLAETLTTVKRQPLRSAAVEIAFDNAPRLWSAAWTDTVTATYPNGDFTYLIGDLTDEWTKSDFARFYSVAKWLSQRGFRVVINPIAFLRDVRESVQNPRSSAMIWNSHGSEDGTIWDSAKVAVPKDAFIKDRSKSLRYVLFANCYGKASIKTYRLKETGLDGYGWDATTNSDELFAYLFGTDFDQHLADALKITLTNKPQQDI